MKIIVDFVVRLLYLCRKIIYQKMKALYQKFEILLQNTPTDFQRYLYEKIPWETE